MPINGNGTHRSHRFWVMPCGLLVIAIAAIVLSEPPSAGVLAASAPATNPAQASDSDEYYTDEDIDKQAEVFFVSSFFYPLFLMLDWKALWWGLI